jgi:hypothetical protein
VLAGIAPGGNDIYSGDNTIKINAAALLASSAGEGGTGLLGALKSTLLFWRQPGTEGGGRSRVLKRSYRTMIRHTWPFMLWGVLIIVINAVSEQAGKRWPEQHPEQQQQQQVQEEGCRGAPLQVAFSQNRLQQSCPLHALEKLQQPTKRG